MLPFLSLLHISPLLALLIIMFLSHLPPSLFLSQVSYSIPNLPTLSSYFHNLLLPYMSIPVTHHHLLLCHHQLPCCLQIQFPHCDRLFAHHSQKRYSLVLLSIPLVILFPLIYYLIPSHVLPPTYLPFVSLRQHMKLYLI